MMTGNSCKTLECNSNLEVAICSVTAHWSRLSVWQAPEEGFNRFNWVV